MPTLSPIQRKIATSAICLLTAILAFSTLLGNLLEETPLVRWDQHAESYVEKTFARAAYTFTIVRSLNGMISVIQGTEIAVSPAGVGLNLSVGEVLDPLNDLAERFSWVMLVSTTALGLQRILMEMSDWLGLQVLLTMGMVLLAISNWRRFWGKLDLQSAGWRLVMLALMVRFMIPSIALISETIYDRFLNPHYEEATQTLTSINNELRKVDPTAEPEPPPSSESKLNELRRWMAEKKNLIDLRTRIEMLGEKLERFTTDTIRLMVVFILQTIIIPLSTFWVLLKLVTYRLSPPYPLGYPSEREAQS